MEIIKCKKLVFKEYVECRKWGLASNNQTTINDDKADLEVDLGLRIFRVTPKRPGAEAFEGPVENIRQWQRATPAPTKRRAAPAAEA